MDMSVNSITRNSILGRVWPLREPISNSMLTFEEWVALGADSENMDGLTSDAMLTLLERAAENRSLDTVDFY
jgi:hypothetical protein